MNQPLPRIAFLPCVDSPEMAACRRQELDIARDFAKDLGLTAVRAAEYGFYENGRGERVEWMPLVTRARDGKRSIKPDDPLPSRSAALHAEMRVQVSNETTLQAARRLVRMGHPTIALNFANGVHPGGGSWGRFETRSRSGRPGRVQGLSGENR